MLLTAGRELHPAHEVTYGIVYPSRHHVKITRIYTVSGYKKRDLGNPSLFAYTALCDMLEGVLNIACPHDVVSGRISARIVIMNGTKVFIAFIHIIEKVHHFLE